VQTGAEGWLLVERPLSGEEGEVKYYYSNLAADTPLERLAQLAHSRWAIEQFYEDAKGECGLDDYQGRLWEGLHRHLALAMLAYSCLVQQRVEAAEEVEGSFSPHKAAQSTRAAPTSASLAPPRSRPLVHHHRPDQALSST
jgi:SRSO17 transposase